MRCTELTLAAAVIDTDVEFIAQTLEKRGVSSEMA